MRELLGAAAQTLGYIALTGAAIWLVVQYAPS